jgi:type II secretion system protein C
MFLSCVIDVRERRSVNSRDRKVHPHRSVRLGFALLVVLLFGDLCVSTALSFPVTVSPQERGGRLPPLTLVGVILSKDASSSIAILKNGQNNQTQMLGIGEKIMDFTLVQVLENSVVLNRSDQTYTIYLGRGRMTRAAQPPQKRPVETSREEPKTEPVAQPGSSSNVIRMEFDRDEVEKRLEAELPLIMKEARFVPNMVEGRVRGFRITRLPRQSILSEVGIRRNDVVLKINEVELNSVEGMLDLYMRFRNESRFEVTLERSGKIIRIQYTLR